ncbi:uncharacterized protein LOC143527644 [Brachyhypopomus gauderio]|uniref:uncharacterized protein LOC143527644 n=1 Tax=Brachyhypopomus gauderio TaxID=698409 RepID=UPI0040426F5D
MLSNTRPHVAWQQHTGQREGSGRRGLIGQISFKRESGLLLVTGKMHRAWCVPTFDLSKPHSTNGDVGTFVRDWCTSQAPLILFLRWKKCHVCEEHEERHPDLPSSSDICFLAPRSPADQGRVAELPYIVPARLWADPLQGGGTLGKPSHMFVCASLLR